MYVDHHWSNTLKVGLGCNIQIVSVVWITVLSELSHQSNQSTPMTEYSHELSKHKMKNGNLSGCKAGNLEGEAFN